MKKMFAALFAAVVMASGLVVATGSTASAQCSPSQYSGCVITKTRVKGPGVAVTGKKITVCAVVKASGLTPNGTVTFNVKRNRGGYSFTKTKRLSGGQACVKTSKLGRPGGYTTTAKYKSPTPSVFLNSQNNKGFDVVR